MNSEKVPGSLSTRNMFAVVHWEKPNNRNKTPLPTKVVEVPWRASAGEVPTCLPHGGREGKAASVQFQWGCGEKLGDHKEPLAKEALQSR